MRSKYQPSLGYLGPTGTPKGLGVFASRAIERGEVVEVAPVVRLNTDFSLLDTDLQRRVFDWEQMASERGVSVLALGYGSMYNHANPANMRYESVLEIAAIRFVAASVIEQGEELTINYNSRSSVSNEDVWFDACRVSLIVTDLDD